MEQVGAIATGHEASARAGAEVLADGGNAVDAAVAAAFAACHCEPTLTGPGGAGFATVHLPNGEDHTFDFFTSVPGIDGVVEVAGQPVPVDVLFGATTQTFHVGPMSVAVPGFVKGVLHIHGRFGSLPLSRVLEPGIRIAREGIQIPASQAYAHHLLTPILTRTEAGRRTFAPRGPMLVAGDRFAQPDLADTLELLANEGEAAFYRGDIAREIVAWSDAQGGLITRADLERYQVVEYAPVRGTWRGLAFVTPPPPSSGGALVAYTLQVLQRANGGVDGPVIDIDSPLGAQQLVAALIAANGIRGSEFDGWLYGEGLVPWLLSESVYGRGDDLFASAHDSSPPPPSSRLGSTTHLSVIDAAGGAVSMTTTTGCGSGEFVGRTGIHMNNMMGEEDLLPIEHVLSPGERLTSMMSPSIVISDGRPILATGSAGSSRLRGAIVQTLLRVLESRRITGAAGLTLQQRLDAAVQAPRLHAEGGIVQVEPGYPEAAVDRLVELGHELNRWPATNMYFGGSNMVAVDSDGSFAAAGDHRRGGGAYVALRDGSVRRA
ncbi:MAG: Gamma-glutamyltransferase [Thermoleophilia bacterium]|nr:Gamma-glutamyltransferase [Thermoleophilia bacterium]